MHKARKIIKTNLQKHRHFEQYFNVIDIISQNEEKNPDICIESCKALIEGISKTILINLDNSRNVRNIDSDNLPKLFKDAMDVLSKNCQSIEGDFVKRFAPIISVLGEIRNKRSDISHGRVAPKFIFSSTILATTVMNITENFIEYILIHYFALDHSSERFEYDSKPMKNFNKWLDEATVFPIQKVNYSKVLYEYDYDNYENIYNTEYQTFLNESEDSDSEYLDSSDDLFEINEPNEPFFRTTKLERFFSDSELTKITEFANSESLNTNKLITLIDKILYDGKAPLRDSVAELFDKKLKLKERYIISELTDRIVQFIQLNFDNDKNRGTDV